MNDNFPDLPELPGIAKPQRYRRLWIPVGVLGGPANTIGMSLMVRPPEAGIVLHDTAWPETLGFGGPVVSTRFVDGAASHEGVLWPHAVGRSGWYFEPFVVLFEPIGRPRWMEPIQPFIMHWGGWPERDANRVRWVRQDAEGEEEEFARWVPNETEGGQLEIRRDRLLPFLAAFDFDLAIYTDSLPVDVMADPGSGYRRSDGGWTITLRTSPADEEGPVRGLVRTLCHLARPAYDESQQPWGRPEEDERVQFLVGLDPDSGTERFGSHPPDSFLTPVFFDPRVLEPFYEDPDRFEVSQAEVRGRTWYLPIEMTEGGLVHAWLGDLNLLPRRARLQWAAYARVTDESVPEQRIARDLRAISVASVQRGFVAPLMTLVADINRRSVEQWGEPLYACLDHRHTDRVRVLRTPANDSWPAFQEQVLTLAVWLVDHIRSRGLDAAGAPATHGTVNRTAELCAALRNANLEEARAGLGGLYAVQNVRSTVAAHRTGDRARTTLERAGIAEDSLGAGFECLVVLVREALVYLRDSLRFGTETALENSDGGSQTDPLETTGD